MVQGPRYLANVWVERWADDATKPWRWRNQRQRKAFNRPAHFATLRQSSDDQDGPPHRV